MASPRTGQVSVSGTAQPLSTGTTTVDEFIVKAPATNAANVYLGPSGVTTSNGHILEPGETLALTIDISSGEPKFEVRPHELYVVGTSGDKVSWLG